MRQFLSFFRQFLKPPANSNTCIFVNIAWKMHCDILKSKFIEIAFIGFTLHEIKQCIVFFGTCTRYVKELKLHCKYRYGSIAVSTLLTRHAPLLR